MEKLINLINLRHLVPGRSKQRLINDPDLNLLSAVAEPGDKISKPIISMCELEEPTSLLFQLQLDSPNTYYNNICV